MAACVPRWWWWWWWRREINLERTRRELQYIFVKGRMARSLPPSAWSVHRSSKSRGVSVVGRTEKKKKVRVVCGVSEVDGGYVSDRGLQRNADRGYLRACVAKGSVGFPLCRSFLVPDRGFTRAHIAHLHAATRLSRENASFGRELLA